MRVAGIALWIGLAGCLKPSAELAMSPENLEALPRLPAPRSGTYARVPTRPADPVIAALVGKLTWDASLGGAAAGLALDAAEGDSGLYGWEVRESAWDAGYPYPVSQVRGWSTPQAAPPPAELITWLGTLDASVDVGLVRARSAKGDSWVALVAKPRLDIGLQPRQADIGDVVMLPATLGASYTVADPSGRVIEGSLDIEQRFSLNLGGEWLFQVSDAAGVAAKYPVYVSMIPPDLALLTASDTPMDDFALREHTSEVLDGIRDAYGHEPWSRDAILEAAARSALEGQLADTAGLASRVGFAPDRLWRLECQAATVEDCIDRILWNPYHRGALVSDTRFWGLAVRRDQAGVRIVAFVAGD